MDATRTGIGMAPLIAGPMALATAAASAPPLPSPQAGYPSTLHVVRGHCAPPRKMK